MKKFAKKRTLSLISGILVLIMISAVCLSCKKTPDEDGANQSESSDIEESVSTVDTDENGFLKDNIGDDIKYGGREIQIIGWSGGGEIDFDTSNETAISKAVYARNKTVESRLEVKLAFDTSLNGGNANRYEYISSVETMLMGGDGHDLIATYSMNAASFAIDGYLLNLASEPQIEFEGSPWWSQDIVENCLINDKIYFASGPISPKAIYETFVMLVNLDMIDEYSLDDPREMVKDYEWTMDKMYEMVLGVGQDITGDGKDETDTHGLVIVEQPADGFLASNGIRYLDVAVNQTTGKETIKISSDFDNGLKTINLVQKLQEKLNTPDVWTTKSAKSFVKGNALFMTAAFDTIRTNKDNIKFNYGYLPYPMADTDQHAYYSTAGFPYSMWCIPKATDDSDCAAYVMECLASESYRQLQPVIYQDIKFRQSNDAINAEMYDMIVDSMIFDYGRLFHNNFEYANSPVWLFRSTMTKGKNFTTNIEGSRDHINGMLASINSALFS